MAYSTIVVIILANILSLCSGSRVSNIQSSTPWPWTQLSKPEIVQNYKEFAASLMKNREISQEDTVVYNPFSVGYALAVMNEKVVLNVSTTGIDSVLKTVPHKIAKSYQTLLRQLSDDSDVTTVSRIYTPKRNNVLLTVGLGKLNTELNLVDMNMNPDEVVEFVNSEVSKHVNNDTGIGNKFFPTGNHEDVLGFLTNTFQYKSKWGLSWSPGPELSFQSLFNSITLPYMGTSGNIPLYKDENFQILKIWMSSRRKFLLLATPKMHLKELSNSVSDVWDEFVEKVFNLKTSDFSETSLDVKIPRFQTISGTSHSAQLKYLGLNDTLCSKNRHYYRGIRVGHLGQLSRIQLSLPYFEFTSITGLKGTQRFYQGVDRRVHVKVQARPERNAVTSVDHASPQKVNQNDNEIVFDQPFFWSFQDEVLGPLALGAVLQPSRNINSISNTFMDPFLECN